MRISFAPFIVAVFAVLIWERAQFVLAADPGDPVTELVGSEDLELALKDLGFDLVHAYTWRGGVLQGKINFQDGSVIKPLDLDSRVLELAKPMFREGETFDPKVLHGAIVIAIKKPENAATKFRTCQISIVVGADIIRDDGKGKKVHHDHKRFSRMFSGQVPKTGETISEFRSSS